MRLVTKDMKFVPSIQVQDENGAIVNNRDLPVAEQIVCEVKMATEEQKNRYAVTITEADLKAKSRKVRTEMNLNKAVKERCTKITGLESFGIVDGASLVAYEATVTTNELISQIYERIMGVDEEESVQGE